MARIWEKWRNFIAFLLTILTIFLSPNCQAATHWIVTENGRIEQQANSLFNLQKPFDLVSFIRQEQKLNKVNLLRKELKNEQDILDEVHRQEQIDLSDTFFKTDPLCRKVKLRWYDLDLALNYIIPFSSKGINIAHHIDLESPIKKHSVKTPLCLRNIPFTLRTYDHLEGVSNRHTIPGVNEQGLLSSMKYVSDVDDWGDRISRALTKNSTSWVLQNMAALYWRIKGNTAQSINCLREAIYYSPSEHRDIALFSLALVLFRSNHSLDAITLLHASLELTKDIGLHKYILGNIYATLQLFNMTELCLKYITLVQPTFQPALKGLKVALCEKRYLEALKDQYSSLEQVLRKVNKHHEKRKTLQKLQELDNIKEQFPYDVFMRQLKRLTKQPVKWSGELPLSDNQEQVPNISLEGNGINDFQKDVVSAIGNKNIDNNEAFTVNVQLDQGGPMVQRKVFCQRADQNGNTVPIPCDLFEVGIKPNGQNMNIEELTKEHLNRKGKKEKVKNEKENIEKLVQENINLLVQETIQNNEKKDKEKKNKEKKKRDSSKEKEEKLKNTKPVCAKNDEKKNEQKGENKNGNKLEKIEEEDDNSDVTIEVVNQLNGIEEKESKKMDDKKVKPKANEAGKKHSNDNSKLEGKSVIGGIDTNKKVNKDPTPKTTKPNKKHETGRRARKPQQDLDNKNLSIKEKTLLQMAHARATLARVRSMLKIPHGSKKSEVPSRGSKHSAGPGGTGQEMFVPDDSKSSKKGESVRSAEDDPAIYKKYSMKHREVDYMGMDTGREKTFCKNPLGSDNSKRKGDTSVRGCQDNTNDVSQKDKNNNINNNKNQDDSQSTDDSEDTAKQSREKSVIKSNQDSKISKNLQNTVKTKSTNQKNPQSTEHSEKDQGVLSGFKEFQDTLMKSKSKQTGNEFDYRNCHLADNPKEVLSYKNNLYSAVVSVASKGIDVSKYVDFYEDISGLPKPPRCLAKIIPGPKSLDHIKGVLQVGKLVLKPESTLKLVLMTHADVLGIQMDVEEMGTRIHRALKKDPQSYVLLNLASLYWRIMGDAYESVRCLRLAIQLSPTESTQDVPFISLSSILFRGGFLEDAATLGKKALKISPNSIIGNFVLANTLAAQGVVTEATQHYLIALQLEPGFGPAIERLKIIQCILWNQQKELEKEAEELRKLLAAT